MPDARPKTILAMASCGVEAQAVTFSKRGSYQRVTTAPE